VIVNASVLATSVERPAGNALAAWLLTQETHALLTRLERVKPFVLRQTMVPAAAPTPAAQVAIDRYLMRDRRRLRARAFAYLRWLAGAGRAATAADMQRRFTVLKLQFNAALSHLDLFAEAIVQRGEHELGVWLAGLDIAAEDALRLPGRYFVAPPIVCHLHGGIGGAIRRARTRLPGGGATPVSIIRIPRERMIGFGIASSLVHEVGHQAAWLLGLTESLRGTLLQQKPQIEPQLQPAWELLRGWISEIVADVWALAKIGISSTLGLMGIVSLPRRFVFHVDATDPHPFPWIRVCLSCAIGDALYPHPQWAQLAGVWRAFYPLEPLAPERAQLVAQLLEVMPRFVAALLTHRPRSLRGKSLADVLTMPSRTPERLGAIFARWKAEPELMRSAAPTLAFAVLGRARITGQLSPQAESKLLSDLLTHWSLHSTLDLLDTCSARWRQPGTAQPRGADAAARLIQLPTTLEHF
jgi:hypothetical protein